MIDKEKIESDIRMALSYISEAKRSLWDEYDEYADIQWWMSQMEIMRNETERLLENYLKGTMK